MPYFKDAQNGLHFLSDEDTANGGLIMLSADCVAIPDAEAEAILNTPSTVELPIVVAMWQARAALDDAGLLVAADAAVAASQNKAVRQYWQYATTLDESNDFTKAFAATLNLTDQQMHALFVAAAAIQL